MAEPWVYVVAWAAAFIAPRMAIFVLDFAHRTRARIRADIAASRDSFPGLSHTAEKERE